MMPGVRIERTFNPYSPETDFHLYSAPESQGQTALTGRVALTSPNPELTNKAQAVFWQALRYTGWHFDDDLVCNADGGQINFYLPDPKKIQQLNCALQLTLGWHRSCNGAQPLSLKTYFAHTERQTIRNGYKNAANVPTSNLYLMQMDFLATIRAAQAIKPQDRSYSTLQVYEASQDPSTLHDPKTITAKHGMKFYLEQKRSLPCLMDKEFLASVKNITTHPIEALNSSFPHKEAGVLKIDMSEGSLRVASGIIPEFITNTVTAGVLRLLGAGGLEGAHGETHEESYFGYYPWSELLAAFYSTNFILPLAELLWEHNYKVIAYPVSNPQIIQTEPDGPFTILHTVNALQEQALESTAKSNGLGLAIAHTRHR